MALSFVEPAEPISFNRARAQHEEYINALRSKIGLTTVILPSSICHPDCVFIEDTAVVIGHLNKAVITRIGAESRQGEVDATKDILERLGLEVFDMRDVKGATCDGGDVLYPANHKTGGKHLFVGMSDRSNRKGSDFLQKVFPEVEVVPVPNIDNSGLLHLKSIVTHIDERTLLLPSGKLGDELYSAMGAAKRGYHSVRVPDLSSCNVVSVNGYVLVPLTSCEESRMIIEKACEERNIKVLTLNSSEFAKVDGALTCKSILL
jgi:dimethylargininase